MVQNEHKFLDVQLFALARQLVGESPIQVSWTDGQTVAALKKLLVDHYPQLKPLLPRLLVAVNNEFAADVQPVQHTDEVACFPPVSGG